MFHSMRKKGGKGTERDLSVWYYADKSLPHNPHASNLFKMLSVLSLFSNLNLTKKDEI